MHCTVPVSNDPVHTHTHTVPLRITSHPPPHTNLEGNPPTTLTVNFSGRMEQGIMVTWYKDGSPLSPELQNNIVTAYDQVELTGSTALELPAIRRRDSGVYMVVLESQLGSEVLARDLRYQEISFQVDVTGKGKPTCSYICVH